MTAPRHMASGQGNGLGGCSSGWGCSLAAVLAALAVGSLLFLAMDAMPPAPTGAQTEERP